MAVDHRFPGMMYCPHLLTMCLYIGITDPQGLEYSLILFSTHELWFVGLSQMFENFFFTVFLLLQFLIFDELKFIKTLLLLFCFLDESYTNESLYLEVQQRCQTIVGKVGCTRSAHQKNTCA